MQKKNTFLLKVEGHTGVPQCNAYMNQKEKLVTFLPTYINLVEVVEDLGIYHKHGQKRVQDYIISQGQIQFDDYNLC